MMMMMQQVKMDPAKMEQLQRENEWHQILLAELNWGGDFDDDEYDQYDQYDQYEYDQYEKEPMVSLYM